MGHLLDQTCSLLDGFSFSDAYNAVRVVLRLKLPEYQAIRSSVHTSLLFVGLGSNTSSVVKHTSLQSVCLGVLFFTRETHNQGNFQKISRQLITKGLRDMHDAGSRTRSERALPQCRNLTSKTAPLWVRHPVSALSIASGACYD